MEYNEFKDEFTRRLNSALGETADLIERTIDKVNAPGLDAISLRYGNMCPTIYIQDMFDLYQKTGQLTETVESAHDMLIEALHKDFSMPELNSEYIKQHSMPRVIGTTGNEAFVKDKPHYHIGDLSVLYAMDIGDFPDGYVWINNDIIQQYHLTAEELHEAAMINMELEPPVIASMSSMLGLPDLDDNMLVVTNQSKLYGATEAFLNPLVHKELQSRLGDYVVLPSSVHEVIAISASGINPDYLKDMVKEVNDTQVDPRDRLSYNVYSYNRAKCCLSIIADNQEQKPPEKQISMKQ